MLIELLIHAPGAPCVSAAMCFRYTVSATPSARQWETVFNGRGIDWVFVVLDGIHEECISVRSASIGWRCVLCRRRIPEQ
jgi:hypothetical protein